MTLCLSLVLCMFAQNQPVIKAPDSVPLGAPIEIAWDNTVSERDFITIVKIDAKEGSYGRYGYANTNPWKTVAPEEAGDYEIRYLAEKRPYATLARKALKVTPVSASIQAPASGGAGTVVEIQWEGPDNPRDFITIVEADAAPRTYKKYKYVKEGSPLKLALPVVPGKYEFRYLTGKKYYTLAKASVEVTAVSASLKAPAQSGAGKPIEVHWEGPNNPRDYLTIVAAGTPEKKYGRYVYTSTGSPVTLPGPDTPGEYEIRYCTGQGNMTLERVSVTIGSASATINAARQVIAGGEVVINWEGPDNPRDFLSIVKVDAKEGLYKQYVYTKQGSPTKLTAPEDAGEYEIRYISGRERKTWGKAPLTVTKVTASLKAADEVKAGQVFEVTWEGPGNARDYIAVSKLGAGQREWEKYSYTFDGNPLPVLAPLEPGNYELRYQTGRKNIILATRPIKVSPPDVKPGRLKVVLPENVTKAFPKGAGLEVILDASGSMLKRLDGKRRIDIAKAVLTDLVTNKIPAGTPMAMRVFGHREADSCRTDLELPLTPLNASKTKALIGNIQAMNLAKTPIADSLAQVANDLAGVGGQKLVILITDGEETCGGDPAATIQALRKQGVDVRVNIVGFAIDDKDLKQTFKLWADLGDGDYFDAMNADQLTQSMTRALQIPYDVLDGAGQKVAEGLIGGTPIGLPAGTYQIKTRENPARTITAIVSPDELETVLLEQ